MADVKKAVGKAKKKAGEVVEKVKKIDKEELKQEIKGLDMGVLYTKAEDVVAKMDIPAKKQAVVDFMDSPATAALKEKVYLVKDFVGYVPYYAQSVPTMIKEALGKE